MRYRYSYNILKNEEENRLELLILNKQLA